MSDISINIWGSVSGYIDITEEFNFDSLIEGWEQEWIDSAYDDISYFKDSILDSQSTDWSSGEIYVKDCDISKDILGLEDTWNKFRKFIEDGKA